MARAPPADHDGALDVGATARLAAHLATARLAAHLQTCASCRARQLELVCLSAQLRTGLPRYTAPEALRRTIAAAVNAQAAPVTRPVAAHRRAVALSGRRDVAAAWWHRVLPIGGAAALAYRRDRHVIDLYVWPRASRLDGPATGGEQSGDNYRRWSQDEMVFWAVSDLNEAERASFVAPWRAMP